MEDDPVDLPLQIGSRGGNTFPTDQMRSGKIRTGNPNRPQTPCKQPPFSRGNKDIVDTLFTLNFLYSKITFLTPDSVDAHSGSDLGPNGLKDRARYDFGRYGASLILFELASYDADYSQGILDPAALTSFQGVLDDLEALAAETGAEFMTLGEFAAA
jgi:hypothetical protein